MLPQGSGRPSATNGGFGGQENISLGEAKPTALPQWANEALTTLTVPPSTLHPTTTRLANGLTLIVQPEDVSDAISVYGHIRNRPETETSRGKEGVSEILDQLFAFGSEHLDRVAFQQALDSIGANESAGTDFSIKVLSKDFDRGVALLADNELHPALPPQALQIIKEQTAQIVATRKQSPAYLARHALRAALFPASDPSLRDATPESVRRLTLDDVRNYYRSTFRPDLTTIIVIGKTTPEQARATVEKYFDAWSASDPKPNTDLPAVPNNHRGSIAVPNASRVQDTVHLAQTLSLTRSDPDFYALELGNNVLGGGFYSARLSIELRKKSGLVYSVGSDLQAGRTRSVYLVEFATDPQNVSRASDMVAREVERMRTTSVALEELTRVKALLLRQIPLSEASVDEIASGWEQMQELNLPLDEPTRAAQRFIDLGPADILAAFRKWMRPSDFVRVSEGPAPR